MYLIEMEMAEVCIMSSSMICRMHWIIISCNETWENETNRAFNLYEREDKCPQDFGEEA
jgi:hypothetical protein